MENNTLSPGAFMIVVLAVLAAGGAGVALMGGGSSHATTTERLNILPSQYFETEDGTKYRLSEEITLPLGERLVGTYYSENCPGESRRIDEDFTSVFTGAPLCEADCADSNSENLELLADSINVCDDYFNLQLTGTNTEETQNDSSNEEELEDFPEGYIFGEEVK